MLMICSSLARNRSPDPVVACCFGRIVPSDAATESCFAAEGNPENEIARFRAFRRQNPAISNRAKPQKQTHIQSLSRCSRPTGLLAYVRVYAFGRRHIGFGASVVSFSLSVETSIKICVGIVRIEPDRLAVVGDSAVIVLLILICERAVVEGDRDVFLCFRTRLNQRGATIDLLIPIDP